QVSVDGGVAPRWRADGRELYFLSPDNGLMAVDVKPGPAPTFGTPHELFREPALVFEERGSEFQPSADGSQFLVLLPVGAATSAPPLNVVTNWQKTFVK
ncbi:MAG: hypothetical protein ABI995_08725, partial [Acidobacteriota bacterium]